jgi:hypothetical protein
VFALQRGHVVAPAQAGILALVVIVIVLTTIPVWLR